MIAIHILNPNQFDVWEGLSGLGERGPREPPPPLLSWLWSKLWLLEKEEWIYRTWLWKNHDKQGSAAKSKVLTLIRLTSERPCQDWEGAPEAPPAILALEQILAQKLCFPKIWHKFQLIWPLFGIFFQKITKKLVKIENSPKNG